MTKVSKTKSHRAKVQEAMARLSHDPLAAPATIIRFEQEHLNAEVVPQGIVGCKITTNVLVSGVLKWIAFYPGSNTRSRDVSGAVSHQAADLHCLKWLLDEHARYHLIIHRPWVFEGACS